MATTLTGGLGIGVRGIGAHGSLGFMVHDYDTGVPMGLTNCHVISEQSDGNCDNLFGTRDVVLAGGDLGIGRVKRVQGPNTGVLGWDDMAVFDIAKREWTYDTNILGIGEVGGVSDPIQGHHVQLYSNIEANCRLRSGDPTAVNCIRRGIISKTGSYASTFVIESDPPGRYFGDPGNSGSVVVDTDMTPPMVVGLVYANMVAGTSAFAFPIKYVLSNEKMSARLYNSLKNPIPLFRYTEDNSENWILSSRWREFTRSGKLLTRNFSFQRREGGIYKDKISENLRTLYRYYNQDNGDSIYTTDYNELKEGNQQYCNMGILGYFPLAIFPEPSGCIGFLMGIDMSTLQIRLKAMG
jgi:hypothetical protein